jgi:hypothetical protein
MKKINLFFALFLISQAFYASENSLSDRHSRAKEQYLETARKLDDFKEELFQKRSSLLEEDQEKLEIMEMQLDGIQCSMLRTDFLIYFDQHTDEQLLQGIKGCVIKYEQDLRKLEIKFHEMRCFFEMKIV